MGCSTMVTKETWAEHGRQSPARTYWFGVVLVSQPSALAGASWGALAVGPAGRVMVASAFRARFRMIAMRSLEASWNFTAECLLCLWC